MKIGFLGPADDDDLLREAVEFLVGDADVDQAIYLGDDDGIARVADAWAREIVGDDVLDRSFLDRAVDLAVDGSPEEIELLLGKQEQLDRLGRIRRLPPPPARAIEMMDDRFLTVVHDKATLTEEDIVNSTLIVYGRSEDVLLKKFGRRYFFTPGPLSKRKVAVFEVDRGQIAVAVYAPSGMPLFRETLQAKASAKIQVSS